MATSDKSRGVLKAHFDSVRKEIAEIEAKSGPLREKRDALQEKLQPVENEMRELAQQIKQLEQPHLAELKMELSALAAALGGKRMSDGAAQAE